MPKKNEKEELPIINIYTKFPVIKFETLGSFSLRMWMMKKTFYYNFIPTKAEEEACKANNTTYQVTRVLVEIRDIYPPPVIDPQNPWQIKKSLSPYEVVTGKLVVSFNDAFDHVFRYWPLHMTNHVVLGHKLPVSVWDVTVDNNPKRYRNAGTFLEMLPNDDYILACSDLMLNRGLSAEDEIGLFWNPRSSTFHFKLLGSNKLII